MVRTYIFKLLECTKVSSQNLHDLHLQSISTLSSGNKQLFFCLPSVFPRAQQSVSVSHRAVSQGLQSWSWHRRAAASGCSPRGGSQVDPGTASVRVLLLSCWPRAGPSE